MGQGRGQGEGYIDRIGTQKQKNKGKKNESIARQRARGGLAKNKAGQLMYKYEKHKQEKRKKLGEHAQKENKRK